MGVFGFFRNIGRAIKNGAETVVRKAKEVIEDVVNFFSADVGGSEPVDDNMDSLINIESKLAKFKNDIEKEAKVLEESKIEALTASFDETLTHLRNTYSEICKLLDDRKKYMIPALRGTIVNFVHIHASENNDGFMSILKMSSGQQKKNKTKEKTAQILERAESLFEQKLSEQMAILNEELEQRLRDELEKKEELLQNEIDIYDELQKQILDDELDLEKYQAFYQYSKEVKECLKVLCEKGK